MNQKIRALGLCSGGLDSMLAALVLQKQGIEVEWISFETPFFSADKARRASQQTGIPLSVRNITPIYLEMLKNPACGYGQHLNPCLDCHSLMFKLAGELMKQRGVHFLFSGEVAGQRPMSQTKSSLRYVEKHSGFKGYILRPLSALLLPPTIPEENGWVNRSLLLGLNGRSRKPQLGLAKAFNIAEFPTPAGGCLLTEDVYSKRLKDLFDHQQVQSERELHLLKYGRHLRLDPQTKIIVGRHRQDNDHIMSYYDPQADVNIHVKDIPGPAVLMPRGGNKKAIETAASICVSYSKAPKDAPVEVVINTSEGQTVLFAESMVQEQINAFFICV